MTQTRLAYPAAINAGIRRARRLRAEAFQGFFRQVFDRRPAKPHGD